MHRGVDRAVQIPRKLVRPSAVPEERLFAEGVDRDPPEVMPAGARKVGEVLLRLIGELDVGGGELAPGTSSDRDRRHDRAGSRDHRQALEKSPVARELERPSSQLPFAGLEPAQTDEEQERQRDSHQEDEHHRRALVDRGLISQVFSEAVACLHCEHRRQRPKRADRQRRQQPEPVSGKHEQAAGGDGESKQAAAREGEIEGE